MPSAAPMNVANTGASFSRPAPPDALLGAGRGRALAPWGPGAGPGSGFFGAWAPPLADASGGISRAPVRRATRTRRAMVGSLADDVAGHRRGGARRAGVVDVV